MFFFSFLIRQTRIRVYSIQYIVYTLCNPCMSWEVFLLQFVRDVREGFFLHKCAVRDHRRHLFRLKFAYREGLLEQMQRLKNGTK